MIQTFFIVSLFENVPIGPVQPRCGAQRSNIGCDQWLGLAFMLHSEYYFPLVPLENSIRV
jgi:hypothetical protein